MLINGIEIMKYHNIIKEAIVNIHQLIFIKLKDMVHLGICSPEYQKNLQKKIFIQKTQYSGNMAWNNSKKRKRFEDFSYRDLQIGERSKSEVDKDEPKFRNVFDNPQNQEEEQEEERQLENNVEENNNNQIKKEDKNENNKEEIKKDEDNNKGNLESKEEQKENVEEKENEIAEGKEKEVVEDKEKE